MRKIEKNLKNILFVAFKNAGLKDEDFEIEEGEPFIIKHHSEDASFEIEKRMNDYYVTYNDSISKWSGAFNRDKLLETFGDWCRMVKSEIYGENLWEKAKQKKPYLKEEFEYFNGDDESVFTNSDLVLYNKILLQLKDKIIALEINQRDQAEIIHRLESIPAPKEGSKKREWTIVVRDKLIGIAFDRLLTKESISFLWHNLEPILSHIVRLLP